MEFDKIIFRGHLVQVLIPTDIKEALKDKGGKDLTFLDFQ